MKIFYFLSFKHSQNQIFIYIYCKGYILLIYAYLDLDELLLLAKEKLWRVCV